ncbi:MAG: hypothetical protein KGJ23_08500 [Euryarchaeota archaeon]|nr:hypothetical protein [Euryarchaeota archaeon]MDE1836642.1 hypothetical protein [Euryarchaeota archaeon]MDE1879163.1 hypothetical protein [Euryarchaeota archaeon]MDE2044612.1 hypothetical protein [Thermoplasmata archaeon]
MKATIHSGHGLASATEGDRLLAELARYGVDEEMVNMATGVTNFALVLNGRPQQTWKMTAEHWLEDLRAGRLR